MDLPERIDCMHSEVCKFDDCLCPLECGSYIVRKNTFKPNYCVSVGKYIKEIIECRGIELTKFLKDIITQDVRLTQEQGSKLEDIFNIGAEIFMGIDKSYYLEQRMLYLKGVFLEVNSD